MREKYTIVEKRDDLPGARILNTFESLDMAQMEIINAISEEVLNYNSYEAELGIMLERDIRDFVFDSVKFVNENKIIVDLNGFDIEFFIVRERIYNE